MPLKLFFSKKNLYNNKITNATTNNLNNKSHADSKWRLFKKKKKKIFDLYPK